jgi:hypothetical protein
MALAGRPLFAVVAGNEPRGSWVTKAGCIVTMKAKRQMLKTNRSW